MFARQHRHRAERVATTTTTATDAATTDNGDGRQQTQSSPATQGPAMKHSANPPPPALNSQSVASTGRQQTKTTRARVHARTHARTVVGRNSQLRLPPRPLLPRAMHSACRVGTGRWRGQVARRGPSNSTQPRPFGPWFRWQNRRALPTPAARRSDLRRRHTQKKTKTPHEERPWRLCCRWYWRPW